MLPSTKVWNVAEIKLRIISQMDDLGDLASLLRTEKRGMALVAGFLFKEVTFEHARSGTSEDPARRKMYEDAISVLNCREFSLTPSMIQKLNIDRKPYDYDDDDDSLPPSPDDNLRFVTDSEPEDGAADRLPEPYLRARSAEYIRTYHPEVLEVLIPTLREQLPGLRKLVFGDPYEPFPRTASWVVDLGRNGQNQRTGLAEGFSSEHVDGGGRVEHVQTWSFALERSPPTTFPDQPQAPPGYSMSSRWDLRLRSRFYLDPTDEEVTAWLRAIQDRPLFASLYRAVGFGLLPITLPIITGLYQRQIAAGHTDRLQVIEAPSIQPFDLHSFQTFTGVASTSLTHLILAKEDVAGEYSVPATMLSGLIRIIGESLTHLISLEFCLDELEGAETLCGDDLRRGMLCQIGSVQTLRVYTDNAPVEPFNVLRVLSPILARNAVVSLMDCDGILRFLTRHIKYLKDAYRIRRPHLATVNFSHLDLTQLESLFDLSFDELGFPQHELVAVVDDQLSEASSNSARQKGSVLPSELTSKLEQARDRLDEATRQLIVLSQRLLDVSTEDALLKEWIQADGEVREQVKVQKAAVKEVLGLQWEGLRCQP